MYNLTSEMYSNLVTVFLQSANATTDWSKLSGIIQQLLPILWIATAIVSTIWMVIRFVSFNFKSATEDQQKYDNAAKARKRALFAWITGLLWPVILLIAWPIAGAIYNAMPGHEQQPFPPLFG